VDVPLSSKQRDVLTWIAEGYDGLVVIAFA
jgi:hypothetical protein